MSYAFYAGILRFIAGKTDTAAEPRAVAMMQELQRAAAAIEREGAVPVVVDRLEVAARAFAGVAGVLQQQILPAAVGDGNAAAERQLRWAVDASMEVVRVLLASAANQVRRDARVELPPPPGAGAN